jgi:hypothetical protein
LNLYAVEGYSHREIAGMLDMKVPAKPVYESKAMLERYFDKRNYTKTKTNLIGWLP